MNNQDKAQEDSSIEVKKEEPKLIDIKTERKLNADLHEKLLKVKFAMGILLKEKKGKAVHWTYFTPEQVYGELIPILDKVKIDLQPRDRDENFVDLYAIDIESGFEKKINSAHKIFSGNSKMGEHNTKASALTYWIRQMLTHTLMLTTAELKKLGEEGEKEKETKKKVNKSTGEVLKVEVKPDSDLDVKLKNSFKEIANGVKIKDPQKMEVFEKLKAYFAKVAPGAKTKDAFNWDNNDKKTLLENIEMFKKQASKPQASEEVKQEIVQEVKEEVKQVVEENKPVVEEKKQETSEDVEAQLAEVKSMFPGSIK